MKKIVLLFPFVLFFACSPDEPELPGDVRVTFTYDQFVLQEDVKGFRVKGRDWNHVFGGVGHILFTEVNGNYILDFEFDGENIEMLSVLVPPGTYDIEMGFNIEDRFALFFPFSASATNIDIVASETIELTVSTDWALVLVDSSPPVGGSTVPGWDFDKDGSIGENGDEGFLTELTGIYYFCYLKEGQDGNLKIWYDDDGYSILTSIVVAPAKVYKYKVVTGGTTNLEMDLYTLFEEYYFEIGGASPGPPTGTEYEALHSLTTPTIDGQVNSAEWSTGNVYNILFTRKDGVDTKEGTLYLQHDGTWLYFGAKTNIDAGFDVYLSLRFDGNNDHALSGNSSEPHTDINVQFRAPGGWGGYIRYDYLDALNIVPTTPPSGTGRASYGSTNVNYEFKIKLSDLNTSAGQVIGFNMFNYNHGNVEQSYEFPINAGTYTPTEWAHIKLQ